MPGIDFAVTGDTNDTDGNTRPTRFQGTVD
jgi:hypothetical protein